METPESESVDRRVLRGQRNREAVIRALAELIEEGDFLPTAEEIAARAGVSVRSIYHYFDDLDDLRYTVIEDHVRDIGRIVQPLPVDGPLEVRLLAFVAQRSELFERAMPIFRFSATLADRAPEVPERLAVGQQVLRELAAQTFAIELTDAEHWKLEAIDAIASVEAWTRLRVVQGLDPDHAAELITHGLLAVLTAP